jgi:hypothetical protein
MARFDKKAACVLVTVVALVLGAAGVADARGGGHRGGGWHGRGGWHGGGWSHGGYWYPRFRVVVPFYYGVGPLWGPGWWGPPYPWYAYPPAGGTVVVQPQTQPYVQQEPQYWYYCRDPEGYYPYVDSCPSGWMTVVPPPAAPQD